MLLPDVVAQSEAFDKVACHMHESASWLQAGSSTAHLGLHSYHTATWAWAQGCASSGIYTLVADLQSTAGGHVLGPDMPAGQLWQALLVLAIDVEGQGHLQHKCFSELLRDGAVLVHDPGT